MTKHTQDTVDTASINVIIPYSPDHTPKEYLNRAVNSIENQTVPTEPVIITDEEKKGPAWARNQGIMKAESKYIAFCDADDYWEDTKLEKQMQKLESEGTSLCITQTVNHDSSDINVSAFNTTSEFAEDLLYQRSQSFTSSMLVDTSKGDVRFNEKLSRREDHLFALQAAAYSGVSFIPEILTIIHKHDSGLSSDGINLEQRIKDEERFYNEAIKFFPRLKDHHSDFWHWRYHRYGRKFYYQGEYNKSCLYLKKALDHKFKIKTIAALLLSHSVNCVR